jgi:O-antigen ligase
MSTMRSGSMSRPVQPFERHAAIRAAQVGRVLVYLAIASLAFMRPQVKLGGLAVVPTDLIAALAGLCWLLACALERRLPRFERFHALLLLYFLAMAISALFAPQPLDRAVKLASEAYLLGLAVLVWGLLVDQEHLRRASRAWLLGTALVAAMAAAALLVAMLDPANPLLRPVQHHLGSLPMGPFVRYRLAYENPNMLGAYLSVSLMVALLAATRGWVGRPTSIALIAGLSMATIATFSAGIGGIILGGALWFWLRRRRTQPGLARATLWVGIAAAAAFAVAQALTPIAYDQPFFSLPVPGTDISLLPTARMRAWIDSLRTFAAHPLTGVGIGMDVARVRFVEPGGARVMLHDAHNVWLNVAAGCGVIGVLAFLAIVVAIWRRTRTAADRAAAGLATVAWGAGVLNVLVYQGIGGAFEDARFIWVAIGLLLVADRADRAISVR